MLTTNDEFRAIHKRNLNRQRNPLNKLQSVNALCGKPVRVLYALLNKGIDYDPMKLASDMERSMKAD